MSEKVRWILLGLGVLIFAGLAYGVMWLFREAAPVRQTLSDGSMVTLCDVVAGTNWFSNDKPIYQIGRKILPRQWQGWILGTSRGSSSLSTNSMTIYMTRKNAAGATLGPFWDSADAIDDAGFVFQNHTGWGRNGDYLNLVLQAFPRRQKTFRLRMHEQNSTATCELMVPNLFPGPFPEWKPEALPATKSNGPVQLTLKSGKIGRRTGDDFYSSWNTILGSDDPLWQKYGERRYFWLTDATGNNGQLLSPRESAWKVHFQCFRKKTTPFRTNEIWVIDHLVAPPAGAFQSLNLTQSIEGVNLSALVFSGAATLVISNGFEFSAKPFVPSYPNQRHRWSRSASGASSWEERGSDCPFMLVDISETDANTEVIFRFRNERGEIIAPEEQPYGYHNQVTPAGKVRRYLKRAQLKPGEKVSFEIVVNHGFEFEFLVSPQDVQDVDQLLRADAALVK